MSYIRGAVPFLIYNPHTRDDIIPDGVASTFELSQEVPGGYEANVQVIRRELKSELLLESCESISFDGINNKIVCSVPAIAAALSVLNVGETVRIQGATNGANNGDFLISSVFYDGSVIEISVEDVLANEAIGQSITVVRRFAGPWEVLEPEIDYTISGTDTQYNRLINFSKVPQEQDVIYVTHRGEATYNFVPTEKSVGPNQLQDNLRNFVVNIFTGDGIQTDFALTQIAVSPRAIEVSINGGIKYGTDNDLSFTGDFDLAPDGLSISFASAPPNGAKIYVRHLGFSTVSRRQALSPSQIGSIAPGAVGPLELANNAVTGPKLNDGSVSGQKILAGAVDGSKILMQNNEWLTWKGGLAPNTTHSVLKLDASNLVTLRSAGGALSLNIADSKLIQFSTTSIIDASASGQVDLGSLSNKFKDAHLSGSVSAASASISANALVGGNLTVSGNITVSGTIDSVDISALQSQVTALASLVAQNSPPGTIKIWAKNAAAPAGFLLCDGSLYSTASYPALFSEIGYAFGGSGGSFAVPDFRGRFPLGKAPSGTASGWGTAGQGGSLDHTHSTPNHVHGLANHIHIVPGHFHGMGPGATLNITSSGSHFTALDHSHGAVTSSSGTPHSHGYSLATSGFNDGAHSHSGTFTSGGSGSLGHYHTGTTNTDGAHAHDIRERLSGDQSGAPVRAVQSIRRVSNVAGTDWFETSGLVRSGNSNHNHAFTTGSSIIGGVGNNLDHTHSISVNFSVSGAHGHSIGGSINNESSHTHSVTIPAFSANSSSNGNHSHPGSSFAGAIGNVSTGADGNSDFSSGPPSPNSTDSGGAGVSGGSNPAFQTINFIIKT